MYDELETVWMEVVVVHSRHYTSICLRDLFRTVTYSYSRYAVPRNTFCGAVTRSEAAGSSETSVKIYDSGRTSQETVIPR
jgi:hypothetical protein